MMWRCKQRARIIGFRGAPRCEWWGNEVGIRQVAPYDSFSILRPCRQVRPDLPIVLCTGSPHPVETARGIDAVLRKPFDLETLGGTITQSLAQRAARDA
jgi:hypothetical protein